MQKIESLAVLFLLTITNIIQTYGVGPNEVLFRNVAKKMNKITKNQLKCSAKILLALQTTTLNSPSVDNVALNNILQFLNYNHRLLSLEHLIQNDILNYSRHIYNIKSNIKTVKRTKFEYLQEISKRMECLMLISSCIDMDLIAKQLTVSKLDKKLKIMELLQPSLNQSMTEFENCEKK